MNPLNGFVFLLFMEIKREEVKVYNKIHCDVRHSWRYPNYVEFLKERNFPST